MGESAESDALPSAHGGGVTKKNAVEDFASSARARGIPREREALGERALSVTHAATLPGSVEALLRASLGPRARRIASRVRASARDEADLVMLCEIEVLAANHPARKKRPEIPAYLEDVRVPVPAEHEGSVEDAVKPSVLKAEREPAADAEASGALRDWVEALPARVALIPEPEPEEDAKKK